MMGEHNRRYLAELRAASAVIRNRGALVTDPDDPEWLGVDESKLPPGFADYYRGLVSAGYALGFI
jgi:hypothetical protein